MSTIKISKIVNEVQSFSSTLNTQIKMESNDENEQETELEIRTLNSHLNNKFKWEMKMKSERKNKRRNTFKSVPKKCKTDCRIPNCLYMQIIWVGSLSKNCNIFFLREISPRIKDKIMNHYELNCLTNFKKLIDKKLSIWILGRKFVNCKYQIIIFILNLVICF